MTVTYTTADAAAKIVVLVIAAAVFAVVPDDPCDSGCTMMNERLKQQGDRATPFRKFDRTCFCYYTPR